MQRAQVAWEAGSSPAPHPGQPRMPDADAGVEESAVRGRDAPSVPLVCVWLRAHPHGILVQRNDMRVETKMIEGTKPEIKKIGSSSAKNDPVEKAEDENTRKQGIILTYFSRLPEISLESNCSFFRKLVCVSQWHETNQPLRGRSAILAYTWEDIIKILTLEMRRRNTNKNYEYFTFL